MKQITLLDLSTRRIVARRTMTEYNEIRYHELNLLAALGTNFQENHNQIYITALKNSTKGKPK